MPNRIIQSLQQITTAASAATSQVRRLGAASRQVKAVGGLRGGAGGVTVQADTRRLERKLDASPAVALRRLRV